MPGISDAELKRRLEAHKYQCPPITGSTKAILIKKLNQLDASQESRRLKSSSAKSSKLFEYSSAEEDANTPTLRRRKNVASSVPTSQRNSTPQPNGKKVSNTRRSANFVPPIHSIKSRNKSTLVQLSDEEEEEDVDDNQVEDTKEDEDEESRKTSSEEDDDEEDDDEEDEEEDALNGRENFGQQTSFLDSPLERSVTNGSGGRSPRFTNSTPISPRSTASYLNGIGSSHNKPPPTAVLFPPNSPLRRAVAKNKEAFGSLGKIKILYHTSTLLFKILFILFRRSFSFEFRKLHRIALACFPSTTYKVDRCWQ